MRSEKQHARITGEEKARALAGIAKRVEVYVEGRLTMNTWESRTAMHRLSVTAWQVMLLGQIGRRKAKVQSRD